jgi:hypothetical protein
MKQRTKQHAVRMLDHAVRLALPTAETGMSEMANGRPASNLRKDVRLLKRLAQDGPEDLFWKNLQKTILKLVKYLNQTRC